MSSPTIPLIVTANDLHSGAVIYFTPSFEWASCRQQAQEFPDRKSAQTALTHAQAQPERAVGPYVVSTQNSRRETFRANGPSYQHQRLTHV